MLCISVYDSHVKGRSVSRQNLAHCVNKHVLLYPLCAVTCASNACFHGYCFSRFSAVAQSTGLKHFL